MPTLRLTDARIKRVAYKPEQGGIQRTWDTVITGLALEVCACGRKSWILRYQVHGRTHGWD